MTVETARGEEVLTFTPFLLLVIYRFGGTRGGNQGSQLGKGRKTGSFEYSEHSPGKALPVVRTTVAKRTLPIEILDKSEGLNWV